MKNSPLFLALEGSWPQALLMSKPEYIQAVILHIHDEHGGYANYLDSIGVIEEERALLIERLCGDYSVS